nr:hypothetical protein CFP56_15459 [Quercus suber]
MTTRFSKAKLTEIREKKSKVGLTGGLLMRKHQQDNKPPKDDPMVTSPIVKVVPQRPSSPTSSLELITDDAPKLKGKDKGSFWDDAGATVLKAHEVILVDDLRPLGMRPPHELMSSHVHKVMQKYVVAKSKVESLSAENELLKSQIFALAEECRKDKERLKTLEKILDTEKAFSRLKNKQIDKAFLKVVKAGSEAMEKFKASDEYLDKLCDYYVESFNLFRKY